MTAMQEIRAMLEDQPVGWKSKRNPAGDYIKRVSQDTWEMVAPATGISWEGPIDEALEFYIDLIDDTTEGE